MPVQKMCGQTDAIVELRKTLIKEKMKQLFDKEGW